MSRHTQEAIAEELREDEPDISNRALARAVGVDPMTVHHDLAVENSTPTLPDGNGAEHLADENVEHSTPLNPIAAKRIFDMWLACYTQEAIAEEVGVHKDTVSEVCRKSADLPKSDKSAAEHATGEQR